MARVVLEKLSKAFGGVHAVKDASLIVQDHEFMVFVGPSGFGINLHRGGGRLAVSNR
jgi:ABC-type sugar transport system ATPase subunit